jgi:predicted anti-sigma-YlaC factor YlaD
MILVGGMGGVLYRRRILEQASSAGYVVFALTGLASGLVFQVLLNGVSAFLYQPFWPSFVAGLTFSLLTIISNAFIFPVCYPLVVKLARRERR